MDLMTFNHEESMEEISRIEDLTHDVVRDNQDSQVLEPLATSEVSDHQPEGSEPATVEFDPLPDVSEEDIELSHWRASVEAYVSMQTKPFTTDQVLTEGMHLFQADDSEWRSDQMRVAAILRELGFDKQQRRIEGVRSQYWSSPTMVAFESRASEVSQPAPAAAREAQLVEPIAGEHVAAAPQQGGSIIGDAVGEDAEPAPSAPAEPAQPSEPAESACDRYARLSVRQTDIKRKLADAQRVLRAAEDTRKKAALAAVDGGFKAEAEYYKAVDEDKAAGAHVEQLTAALTQIGEDLRHVSVEMEAERRVTQCRHIREAAGRVEDFGTRIEATLAEAGKLINAYLHNVDLIYRRSIPVLSGQPECAMPMTEPVAHAILGHFLRHARLDPNFFSDMNLSSLLSFESPRQIVDMQLDAIVDRLVDNHWMALAEPNPHWMSEPITDERDRTYVRKPVGHVGHELVPAGIFPTLRPADAEGDEA